jgi:hypothetical protein
VVYWTLTFHSLAECPDFENFFIGINPAQKTWKDFYQLYSKCQRYDDGAYGEGFSDFVVQSLAKYWSRFDELFFLIKKDPSFKKFVLKHIDASTDLGDLNLVLKNVREHCPESGVSFCKEIGKEAISAIEEIKTIEE